MKTLARRIAALIALVATGAALLCVSTASASTIGGVEAEHLGTATAQTRGFDAVEMEWEAQPRSEHWGIAGVTLRPQRADVEAGQLTPVEFAAGDRIDLAFARSGGGACEVHATFEGNPAAEMRLPLADMTCADSSPVEAVLFRSTPSVSLAVTSATGELIGETSLGDLSGALTSFNAPLASMINADVTERTEQCGDGLLSDRTCVPGDDTDYLTAFIADLPRRASIDELDGSRLELALYEGHSLVETVSAPLRHFPGSFDGPAGEVTAYVTTADEWRQLGGQQPTGDNHPVVLADFSKLEDADLLDADGFSMYTAAVLTPRTLSVSAEPEVAVALFSGTVETDPGVPILLATEPVRVTEGISYDTGALSGGPGAWENQLRFCYTFEIENTTSADLRWEVQYRTTNPPMFGMNPIELQAADRLYGNGFETKSYDPATNLWTIGGVADPWHPTDVLAPGATHHVNFCARGITIPDPDPSQYDAHLEFRNVRPDWNGTIADVHIVVETEWPTMIPWQVEVDLRDLVCPAAVDTALDRLSIYNVTDVSDSSDAYRMTLRHGMRIVDSRGHDILIGTVGFPAGVDWDPSDGCAPAP